MERTGGCRDGNDNDAENIWLRMLDWTHVEAGQLIEAKLDVVMANDITGPMALPIIKADVRHVYSIRIK